MANNHLTDYLAKHQQSGHVRSVKQLILYTKSTVADLFTHLNRLRSRHELDYLVLDKIAGDRYIFLTSANGYDSYKLLLPTPSERVEDKAWAQQIYPLAIKYYTTAFITPEAKEWRTCHLPVYRTAWFRGPLAAEFKAGKEITYTQPEDLVLGNQPIHPRVLRKDVQAKQPNRMKRVYTMMVVDENIADPEYLPCIDIDSMGKG